MSSLHKCAHLIVAEKPTNANFKDETGNRFGKLTVIGYAGKRAGRSAWLCRCDCGNETVGLAWSLRSGDKKTCGCTPSAGGTTHGLASSGLYKSWHGMHQRCANPDAINYADYGGRGIKVCERWQSIKNFVADMGLRPEGLTLERIDNDGNYEPGNCRWATASEQQNNTRRTRFVEVGGVRLPLAIACRSAGVDLEIVRKRLSRGLTFEQAVA